MHRSVTFSSKLSASCQFSSDGHRVGETLSLSIVPETAALAQSKDTENSPLPAAQRALLMYLVVSGLVAACRTFVTSYGVSFVVHRLSNCGTQAQLPDGMWDLSFPTRDQTRFPCLGKQILNHWTAREVPRGALGLVSNVRVPGHELPSCKPGGL